MAQGQGGHSPIRPKVLKYFDDHIGLLVHRDDIVSGLGLTVGQVTGAISNIRREAKYAHRLESFGRGGPWRWSGINGGRPAETSPFEGEVWEFVKQLKSGDILIEDTQGNLYRAKAVE